MRFDPQVEQWRIYGGPYGTSLGDDYGAFEVDGPCGRTLRVIASSSDQKEGIDWEHVSVSLSNRNPNWEEMCYIKALFWDVEETVMQLHPPQSKWINNHPHCLHMWKPTNQEIPLPPSITVGSAQHGVLTPGQAKQLADDLARKL